MKLATPFPKKQKKLVDSYTFEADYVPVSVKVYDVTGENTFEYEVVAPTVSETTQVLLDSLKDRVARRVPIGVESITDPEQAKEIRSAFLSEIISVIQTEFSHLDEKSTHILAGRMLHATYGLGILEFILADNFLEEVVINGSKHSVSVYHKKLGWCQTNVWLNSEDETLVLSSQIGRKVGREINVLNPIMDAHLLTGDRVASTLYPVSTAGHTITIRRFARTPWTVTHFVSPDYGTFSVEIGAIIWLAMQYELNIIVAGGTASGKTSVLNSLCSFIPPKQRIVSVEDTREIALPETLQWNWVPLNSRNANPEGQGEVTMLDCIVASLRMRPDRIVVGEIRRREQAEALFEAMHTGHSVYGTMHADTVQQVKRRLIQPPIAIPLTELESLHLVLIQFRDRRKGLRRTLELAEIVQGGSSKGDLELNYLYRWRARSDTFEKVSDSIRLFEDLNLHTGMTLSEIKADLREKEKILKWMVAKKIYDIDVVGTIMKMYYKDKESLMKIVNKNAEFSAPSHAP